MPNTHGDFIWYELLTSNADAAQDFYGPLIGWNFADSGQADMDYRIFSAGDNGVGGVMAINDEMKAHGAQPVWLGYIAVDDVDATAQSIGDAGGAVHMPAMDVPDVGRMAMVADAQGAVFYIMTPAPPEGNPDASSTAFAYDTPMDGHCAWNELATGDQDAAIALYTHQFGWRQEGDMDMGPMGKYKFFYHSDKMLGAVMPKPDAMPVSLWSYYFRVPDIDAAAETIKTKGGQITHGPQEIPGGDFSLSGIDPQGAHFALVGGKRE